MSTASHLRARIAARAGASAAPTLLPARQRVGAGCGRRRPQRQGETPRGQAPTWVAYSTEAEAGSSKGADPQAAVEEEEVEAQEPEPELPPLGPEYIPVLSLSELPKGTRKQVTVDNKEVMLFWYRKELRGIEAKSTAEAFYSEGFLNAKFTQDYGIVCPTTASVFSIVDGSILDWYPSNPVLRQLTPKDTCRPIEVYDVQERGGVLHVNPAGSLEDWQPESGLRSDFTMPGAVGTAKGGSDTSVENNNVYGVEPKMYIQGTDPDASPNLEEEATTSAVQNVSPATLVAGIVAVGIIAVAGTGVCVFYQNWVGLAVFWLLGISAVGYTAQTLTNFGADDSTNRM